MKRSAARTAAARQVVYHTTQSIADSNEPAIGFPLPLPTRLPPHPKSPAGFPHFSSSLRLVHVIPAFLVILASCPRYPHTPRYPDIRSRHPHTPRYPDIRSRHPTPPSVIPAKAGIQRFTSNARPLAPSRKSKRNRGVTALARTTADRRFPRPIAPPAREESEALRTKARRRGTPSKRNRPRPIA